MPAYFDYNATTPLSPAARQAWLHAADHHWHNPSSLYREAGFASQRLEAARERLAALLDLDAERILFTSGATESNNTLFAGLARCLAPDAAVAISAIEHPSVREAARAWLGRARVVEIPVNNEGLVTVPALERIIATHAPACVSIMAANNESGVLQPIAQLAAVCRSHRIPLHSDAAQWLGKLPAKGLAVCDYLTASAHKFGGPKGAGFLVLAHAEETFPLLHGGPQENQRRAGTENYPAIEAMVAALEVLEPRLTAVAAEQTLLRDRLIAKLHAALPGLRLISAGAPRLWNTVLAVMPRHDNLKWLTRLTRRGFAISTGSACSSGKEGSSVVVQALGATPEELRRVIRISAGWDTTPAEWQSLAVALFETAAELDAGGIPRAG